MKARSLILFALTILLSVFFQSPIPIYVVGGFVLILLVVRDTVHGVRSVPYRERYITESIDPEGRPTNLYGELVSFDSDSDSGREQHARRQRDLDDWNTENHTQPPAVR